MDMLSYNLDVEVDSLPEEEFAALTEWVEDKVRRDDERGEFYLECGDGCLVFKKP